VAKKASNWIMTEMLRELKGEEISFCKVRPPQLAALLSMVEKNTISGKIAKTVFLDMMASGKDPATIVKEKNLVQVSDVGELLALVKKIVAANPNQAEDYRAGKTKLMGFFVGQLMQKTRGQANPQLANELFVKELGS
jgi:aspartyl-tRNA(Asn)/glutamyl-tRNA(Gln) amidotransferase subunit B